MLKCIPFLLLDVLALSAQVSVYPVDLGPQTVGDQVGFSYRAEGGQPPYRWRVIAGSVPKGLALSMAGSLNGMLTGSGHYSYRLMATDANGVRGTAEMTFDVVPRPLASRVGHALFTGESGLWIARGALFYSERRDYVTTIQCIQANACMEGNPLLLAAGINPATVRGRREFLGLKIGGPLITIGSQEFLRWTKPQMFNANTFIPATWTAAAIQGGVDYHNAQLLVVQH